MPVSNARRSRRPRFMLSLALMGGVGISIGTLIGTLIGTMSGCSGDRPAPARQAEKAEGSIPGYELEELSSVGFHLEGLDEGRLDVAPPIEWYPAPRGKDYVVRFVRDRRQRSPLPRITVEAGAWDIEGIGILSAGNLPRFCEAVAGDLGDPTRRALAEDVRPLKLGPVLCAYYVIHKEYRVGDKSIRGSRAVIRTLQHGRLYTVSLDAYAGKLADYLADVFAVAAHMRFLDPEAEGAGEARDRGGQDEKPQSESFESAAGDAAEGDGQPRRPSE